MFPRASGTPAPQQPDKRDNNNQINQTRLATTNFCSPPLKLLNPSKHQETMEGMFVASTHSVHRTEDER